VFFILKQHRYRGENWD